MHIYFIQSVILLTLACNPANAENIIFSSTVPTDVSGGVNASKQQLASFAWQEFIALNWPAKPNPSPAVGMSDFYRGQADSSALASTGSGGTLVWHTFSHRVELYPPNAATGTNLLPDINAIPKYLYPSYQVITPASASTSLTLFNNMDEASEIGLADMYYKPFAIAAQTLMQNYGATASHTQMNDINDMATQAAIVYEVKANPVIYNYVNNKGFQAKTTRATAAAQTLKKITNQSYDANNTFELPTGSLETKASWRRYDANADDLNDFIWQKGIYYTGEITAATAHNDIFLLVGLHIIQKTPSYPEFTFATFEHVSNESNGFLFKNTAPQSQTVPGISRKLPDPGIIEASRQFPIPDSSSSFDLTAFNSQVQQQLKSQYGNDVFLANYQLIGVQATVADSPSTSVPAQEFYLSNFATETNNTLQFFQGGLQGSVPNPDLPVVHAVNSTTNQYQGHTSGGCQGCHGAAAQNLGYDFSVIAATGNALTLEPIEPYPGGQIVPQNPSGFPLTQSTNNSGTNTTHSTASNQ